MDPTFKIDEIVYASSLLKIDNNDIISYNAKPLPNERIEEYTGICRVVGKAGDKIEIKHGCLFRNNQLVDDTLNLGYNFIINSSQMDFIFLKYDMKHKVFQYSDSSFILNFTYNQLKYYNIENKCRRIKDTSAFLINPTLFSEKATYCNWTLDDFGPVVVPQAHMFLLGDNRSNSMDSRMRGFVPYTSIVAKIIN